MAYFVASPAPVSLRMYTNGSRSSQFFRKMMATVRDCCFGVIFSFVRNSPNSRSSSAMWNLTAGGGMAVGISFMFVPSKREQARRYIEELLALQMKMPFFMSLNYPYLPDGVMGTG